MTEEQLKEAISEFDIGNKVIARQILMDVVENEPDNEDAWLLLSIYGETAEQRIFALKKAISKNPDNPSTNEALKQYGFSSEESEDGRIELYPIPAIYANPYQHKKEYAFWSQPPHDLPATSREKPGNEAQARNERLPANNFYRVGIGLLGGAILLWGMFIGILIKGQEPPFIPVTGINSTSTVTISTAALETVQNISDNIPTPTYTLQLSATNLPTPNQTPTITIQPAASETQTQTVQSTSTFLPTETKAPSKTPIPSYTSSPTIQFLAGTLDNPVKAGDGYRFAGNGIMTVQSSSWVTGKIGIVSLLIAFNCERPASEICPTETFKFDLVASSGSVYSRENNPAIPLPSFGSIINLPTYGGSIERGYVGFSITGPESSLLLRVGNTLEPGLETYFRLP